MAKKKHSLNKKSINNLVTYGIALAFFAVMFTLSEFGILSSHMKGLLVPICIYIILAVSLNLVVGILGELSLGHAGFMCVGAYTSSFFSVAMKGTIENDGLRFFLALLIGALCAAVFGALIGIPVLRLNGDYLAIVTLAFGEIIKNIFQILYVGIDSEGIKASVTSSNDVGLLSDGKMIIKGALGITGTPRQSTFIIAFIFVMLVLVVSLNLINSRTGRAVMSIRDNKIAAESIGINVSKYKLLVFTLSAAFAGIAGVLYSHNLASLTATTNNFGYNMSIVILVLVVLGGIGSIRGSFISAIILTALPELLRSVGDYRMLIYAVLLIAMMLLNNNEKLKGVGGRVSFKAFMDNRKNRKGGNV